LAAHRRVRRAVSANIGLDDAEETSMRLTLPKFKATATKSNGIQGTVEDVRRMISEGAEQAAEQVANIAGQVSEEAAKLSHEAGREGGKRGQEATAQAGKLARDLAQGGQEGLRTLGKDLRDLSREVRTLRVTRQRPGPNMLPGIALIAGLGSGLAAMFFLDPEQGRRRRALLRDKLAKWTRIGRQTLSGRAEDLRNRSIGLGHEVRKAVSGADDNGYSAAEELDQSPDASAELETTDQVSTSGVSY
jgi:hypothetical protein